MANGILGYIFSALWIASMIWQGYSLGRFLVCFGLTLCYLVFASVVFQIKVSRYLNA